MLPPRLSVALAVAAGIGLELGIQALTGRREAWDSSLYWTAGVPIALGFALVIGWTARDRGWLAPAAIIPAQVTTMMLCTDGVSAIWPLLMILASVLGLPFVAAGLAGKKLRQATAGAGGRDR